MQPVSERCENTENIARERDPYEVQTSRFPREDRNLLVSEAGLDVDVDAAVERSSRRLGTIGIILVIIGVVHMVLGRLGYSFGGRAHYW